MMIIFILQTASPDEVSGFTSFIRDLDSLGLLVLFVILLYRGDIKWGKDYDNLKEERDKAIEVLDKYHDRIEEKLSKLEQAREGQK
jgi:hypothetical protein